MLAPCAAHGDPHFPFLLPCHAQVTLSPRLLSSLSKANDFVPSRKSLCSSLESDDHLELPSPPQCSVKVEIPGSDPALMNMLDCQIFPLGQRYRMVGWEWRSTRGCRGVGFLPINEDQGGEFIILLNLTEILLVLRSSEMRWMQVKKFAEGSWNDLIAFRGRFYTTVLHLEAFVIYPYSLEATLLMPMQPVPWIKHLVAFGNDELFLVEKSRPPPADYLWFECRVSRLDEEAGKWVEVSDLGDRVLFIGHFGNVSCSAKELPDGCGVSGNSILFTNVSGNVISSFRYGVHTGCEEDDLNFWRPSRENRVTILSKYPLVALRVEH